VVNERELTVLLAEFARTLLTDFAVQEILDEVVLRVVDILPVTGAGITLVGPDHRPEYVAASSPQSLTFERLQTELGEGPCREASASGEAVSVPDLTEDTLSPAFSRAASETGCAAAFSFPLRHGHSRLGALDLYRDTPGDLDVHQTQTAQTLADVAAAYVVNAQLRERAQQDVDWFRTRALHDPLTGLANRVLLVERLEHAAQRIPRAHTAAAVLFVDLDRFKSVNDRYGHMVGDDLLIAVADRLAGVVRPGDTLARISGDEFVLLCEDLNGPEEIEAIARRVRETFATPFVVDRLELTVKASVGIARTAPGETPSRRLLAEADHAMYRDKDDRHRAEVIDLTRAARPSRGDA
jgi:diguanylate cyclase (GGDEF)-like protein